MANLLSPSSPNLIANGSEIGVVFLGYLLRNPLPQIGNLVFNHQIPQDLIQKWQAKLDSRDAPLNPPLMEVTSTVVKPFFDSPNVGTAQALIQQFQEKINQSNSNNTKPLTSNTPSFEGLGEEKILSVGGSSLSPLIEISQLPPRASWSSFDLSSSEIATNEIKPSLQYPNSSNNSSPRFLRPPPQDLQPRRSPSPLIIINEPNKENAGEVLANNGGAFVISQSDSCFAEILPTAISSQNTLSNLSSSAPNDIQPLKLQNPSPPKNPPLSTPPKAVNDKNNSSCLDEALKFFTDLIEKCCNPTKISARPLVERANDSRVV